ncbi:YfiR family protein [Pseudoduganella sp. LjRoot289]|uniref:YfiR family protein n=1 Tax=Pseudoduganella sp. LjRoot289 TaxID=3342314 RepID=UPI003ECF709C
MSAVRGLAWTLAAVLWAGGARAGDGQADAEYKIKASYIYKFASYVDWPPGDAGAAPFVIGIVDADSLAEELKKLSATHPLKNRPVQIRMLAAGAVPAGLQLLYIGQRAARSARGMLDSVAAQPVLTVTESAGMLTSGSVINLLLVDERIRFEISLPHAEARQLKISARLLDVAYRVEGKSP